MLSVRFGLVLMSVVVVVVSGCGKAAVNNPPIENSPTPTLPAPVPPTTGLHHGIDVSTHSGTVDWKSVRDEGHSFAFIKASEGVDLADPDFGANWKAAGDAGLVRGAYHFFVTEDDPGQQARLFIETVQLEPGDLAPVVDIELIGHGTSHGLPDRLGRFLELLEKHYGVRPIIYTSPNFWNKNFGAGFGHYPLWVADYGVDEPTIPDGWEDWHLWQWKGDAAVHGVEKSADLSRVNRQADDLHRLLVPPRSDQPDQPAGALSPMGMRDGEGS